MRAIVKSLLMSGLLVAAVSVNAAGGSIINNSAETVSSTGCSLPVTKPPGTATVRLVDFPKTVSAHSEDSFEITKVSKGDKFCFSYKNTNTICDYTFTITSDDGRFTVAAKERQTDGIHVTVHPLPCEIHNNNLIINQE